MTIITFFVYFWGEIINTHATKHPQNEKGCLHIIYHQPICMHFITFKGQDFQTFVRLTASYQCQPSL